MTVAICLNLLAVAGLVSMWGLFNAQLLYVSRLPYVLSRDGWLPKTLARVSTTAALPRVAILCSGAIAALFATLSFGSLAIIQCLLYAGALTLEFLALLVLRTRQPDGRRAFKIPCGWWEWSTYASRHLALPLFCSSPLSPIGGLFPASFSASFWSCSAQCPCIFSGVGSRPSAAAIASRPWRVLHPA